MMDANQVWDVGQAIDWIADLAPFDPWWIEEPTSPDDVLGHATIARAVAPIGIATGEQCQNRVLFKQFLQARAMDFCQIDSCRLGGVNEVLAVLLMAAKFGVPVCPHAGGVGLCEYVQHLAVFDYIAVSASLAVGCVWATLAPAPAKRPASATTSGFTLITQSSVPSPARQPSRPDVR